MGNKCTMNRVFLLDTKKHFMLKKSWCRWAIQSIMRSLTTRFDYIRAWFDYISYINIWIKNKINVTEKQALNKSYFLVLTKNYVSTLVLLISTLTVGVHRFYCKTFWVYVNECCFHVYWSIMTLINCVLKR